MINYRVASIITAYLTSFVLLIWLQVANASTINQTVTKLSKNAPGLDKKVLTLAVNAYETAKKQGKIKNQTLTIIDYSKPSSQKRMWVFDLRNHSLRYYTHVSHGVNSGGNKPTKFSNTPGSKQTSIGTFVTADTYHGANGYSLNLHGLERGFNDNALQRRIVVHGADYANESFVKNNGRLGRSWGCPAVSRALAKPIINTIKGGSLIFAYYPKTAWLSQSQYVA